MILCLCNDLNSDDIEQAVRQGSRCYPSALSFHGAVVQCGTCEHSVSCCINKFEEEAMTKSRIVYRDAETGEFVSEEFALENPRTTVKEKIIEELPREETVVQHTK